jgi:hypothetical protein
MVAVLQRLSLTALSRCLPKRLRSTTPLIIQTRSLFAFPLFFREMSSIEYPETRRDDLVEKLHGVKVADPYRFLEDPKSPETTVPISDIFHDSY